MPSFLKQFNEDHTLVQESLYSEDPQVLEIARVAVTRFTAYLSAVEALKQEVNHVEKSTPVRNGSSGGYSGK